MLISPISDSEGRLRGVIQLFNKTNRGITNSDRDEIESYNVVLGDIFKTASEQYEIDKVKDDTE